MAQKNNTLAPDCKLYILNKEGRKTFGKGPWLLLQKTEELGSLNKAAQSMDMAYSKAFRLIKDAEEAVGTPLLERRTGGKSGGGSSLTPAAREWMHKYTTWEQSVKEYMLASYHDIFEE